MRVLIALAFALFFGPSAMAADANLNCFTGISGAAAGWAPCSPTNVFPVTGLNNINTYSVGTGNLQNTGAGDIYCITGSASKTVKVRAIRISAIANAASAADVIVIKRSSAESGGTPVVLTPVPHDSANPAATAAVTAYSTSPTPGSAVGGVRGVKLAVGTTGNTNTIGDETFNFAQYWAQPIVLRGTSESLCVNITALGTGASIDIGSEHTEE